MTVTVVIPQTMAEELRSVAKLADETAGVMLAGIAQAPNGDIKVLGRQMRWVDESAYLRREPYRLSIRSDGYVHALGAGETLGAA